MSDVPAANTAAPTKAPPRGGSLLDEAHGLLADVRGAFSERVELLSLELGSALRAVGQIAALVVAAAIVVVTAWLGVWAVVAGVLISVGMPWVSALLVVIVVNLGAAAWALLRARKLLPRLSLPATRRHLTLAPAVTPPPAAPPAPGSAPSGGIAPRAEAGGMAPRSDTPSMAPRAEGGSHPRSATASSGEPPSRHSHSPTH